MSDCKYYKQMSPSLMIVILIGITYSFGTFGLLNIFGLRVPVQAIFVILSVAILLSIRCTYRTIDIIFVMMLAFMMGVGGVAHGGNITAPIESLLMIFCIVALLQSPLAHAIKFSKALVISSAIFCFFVAIAYAYYSFYPDQYEYANHNIYDSDVGSDRIYPNIFADWISFTSGDGYVFQERTQIRLKGYSNEPSSTMVHYLAPVALTFFLGGRYLYIGIFMLLVNTVFIASLMTHLAILLSAAIFFVLFLKTQYLKFMLVVLLLAFMTLLSQPTVIGGIFSRVGMMGMDLFGLDLISRKVGDGTNGSIFVRLQGIAEGFSMIATSPVGFSYDKLGAGAGLLFIVGASSGWLGLFVFSRFVGGFIKGALNYSKRSMSYGEQYAVALTISLLFVATLISGYGWERPPGIIILLLLYKLMAANISVRDPIAESSKLTNLRAKSNCGGESCA